MFGCQDVVIAARARMLLGGVDAPYNEFRLMYSKRIQTPDARPCNL